MMQLPVAIAFVLSGAASPPASFGPLDNGVWVDTPKGRFECQFTTGGVQHLKLDGKPIYEGFEPDVVRDGPISEGFLAGDSAGVGCFDVIDNHAGYLVIYRTIGPPWYGHHDLAVIDFNASPPTITELVEGDTPTGKSKEPIVLWKANGFSVRYHGLPLGVERDSEGAPAPASHRLWFDFEAKKSTQIR
jgi:hypothetical protein